MKKTLKLWLPLLIVLAILVAPSKMYASNELQIAADDNFDDLEVVLAYYDLDTQTETLYTAKELQERFSANSSYGDSLVASAPMEPTVISSEKKLTPQEKASFLEAERNTLEKYGTATLKNSFNLLAAKDNRKQVDEKSNPYYRIAKCQFTKYTDKNKTKIAAYEGTGFAVGYNLCATARHCITDDYGNFVTHFWAYYGYDGVDDTYTNRITDVAGYVYFPQYITGTNADGTIKTDPAYDIAFVIWEEQTVSLTGCFGMSSNISQNMSIRSAGYPGDLNDGDLMYETKGNILSFNNLTLSSNHCAAPGQSGSPYFDDNFYAYAVLTGGYSDGTVAGCRITATLIQWLKDQGHV